MKLPFPFLSLLSLLLIAIGSILFFYWLFIYALLFWIIWGEFLRDLNILLFLQGLAVSLLSPAALAAAACLSLGLFCRRFTGPAAIKPQSPQS